MRGKMELCWDLVANASAKVVGKRESANADETVFLVTTSEQSRCAEDLSLYWWDTDGYSIKWRLPLHRQRFGTFVELWQQHRWRKHWVLCSGQFFSRSFWPKQWLSRLLLSSKTWKGQTQRDGGTVRQKSRQLLKSCVTCSGRCNMPGPTEVYKRCNNLKKKKEENPEEEFKPSSSPLHSKLLKISSGKKKRALWQMFTSSSSFSQWLGTCSTQLGSASNTKPMQPVTVYIQCEVSPGLIYTFPIETGFSTYILLCQHWRNRKSTLRMDITDSLSD